MARKKNKIFSIRMKLPALCIGRDDGDGTVCRQISVADPDPGSIIFYPNNPDPIFWVEIIEFFEADTRMEKNPSGIRNRK
jgi:hypothetical protein